jgi:hypothetical protein
MKPGNTPNDTQSARESNCFPSSPETFNRRAANPSKKSKTADKTMKYAPERTFPFKTKLIPITPERRFIRVKPLGICFKNFNSSRFYLQKGCKSFQILWRFQVRDLDIRWYLPAG